MADFIDTELRASRFENADLREATFHGVDLTGAVFRSVDLVQVEMKGVEIFNVRISGWVDNLNINGVDVAPIIESELNRRYPMRSKMKPDGPAGFREAWDILTDLWDGTVARARELAPELLHVSVDGEWSFIQTLRHLAFATDSWISRAILGNPSPWDELELPWDEMPDTPGVPRDLGARPSLDTALALRSSRMAIVRSYLDGLTDDSLAADTTPVLEPGWPRPRSYPVRECLLTVLNEEWEHRLFAERDLDVLRARS